MPRRPLICAAAFSAVSAVRWWFKWRGGPTRATWQTNVVSANFLLYCLTLGTVPALLIG